MTSATIKLFLPRGDARGLRTAEISNWNGKAIAAPRTEFDELLARPELDRAGIYLLLGTDPARNAPKAYVGEAEVLRERLKQHRAREFWVSAIAFTSKDETLTKAHVRHLEHQILAKAAAIGCGTVKEHTETDSESTPTWVSIRPPRLVEWFSIDFALPTVETLSLHGGAEG